MSLILPDDLRRERELRLLMVEVQRRCHALESVVSDAMELLDPADDLWVELSHLRDSLGP